MTFHTFYSNIYVQFRGLKSLTVLFRDLEFVFISVGSRIKLEN